MKCCATLPSMPNLRLTIVPFAAIEEPTRVVLRPDEEGICAAIVASASSGQQLASPPVPCLVAIRARDGGWHFADGVLAASGVPECRVLQEPWPELHRALKLPVREIASFMKRDEEEPRHNRVQIWHLGLYHPNNPKGCPDAKGVTALELLRRWNGWQQDPRLKAPHKVEDFYGEGVLSKLKRQAVQSKYRALMKLAADMGLPAGAVTDFDTPMKALRRELDDIWAGR